LEQDTGKWYQLAAAEVMASLSSDANGLGMAEATSRLEKYGHNELTFEKPSALMRFLRQFRSGLIYLLLAAAVVTAALEMWVDSAVIFVVVVANAIIGFIQEGKAEGSMEVLTKMMVLECTVLRDGARRDIPARELVPGDVVLLEEGDRVPADLRLVYVRNLAVDEAPLTGESVPVGGPAVHAVQRHVRVPGLRSWDGRRYRGADRDRQDRHVDEGDEGRGGAADEEDSPVHQGHRHRGPDTGGHQPHPGSHARGVRLRVLLPCVRLARGRRDP
jgi:hypothetical protein